ncbi:hypothetical protein Tco_1069864, partial [Tanacetum coccineum]
VGTTTTTNLTARLPILNPADYDLWLMRIEQYFLMTDYSLWEVIKNGNKVLRRTVGTVEQEYEPTTAEEKQDRRNEMKARATLLIEKETMGDKESKKVQRTLLKQQYENFAALSKLRLLDNDVNPLVPTGIMESDSEVELVFPETTNLRIPTSGKDGSDKGYGTNSLLEQWRDSYPDNDDYDPLDDDMYENYDLSEHLQSICDDLDITVRGRKKK